MQEIWVSVFRALLKLNDAAAFRAWVFRIARDRVCREFRRHRIEFHSISEQHLEPVNSDDDLTEAVDREAVRQRLEQLSTEHREALVLRFIEEMSYDDIARVTGSTLGTVRSRIHYARRALRRAFEKGSYEIK